MMITDANGKDPIWHNKQWMIFDDVIEQIRPKSQSMAYWMGKDWIERDPVGMYKHIVEKKWCNPRELLGAFLHIRKFWGFDLDCYALLGAMLEEYEERELASECEKIRPTKNRGVPVTELFELDELRSRIISERPEKYPILSRKANT